MIRRTGIAAALIALLVVGVLASTVRAGIGSTIYLPIVDNCPALVCDDFSNPASGWPTGPVFDAHGSPIATFAYTSDGTYQMLFQQAGYLVQAGHNYLVSDFQVEADVWPATTNTDGTIGFDFDKGSAGFYDFEVGLGYYYLAWYSYSTQQWTYLVPFTPASVILTGNQPNHIKVVRQGAMISLYANNQLLKQITDSASLAGYVDLAAFANSVPTAFDARFDNFVLYALKSTPTSATSAQAQTVGREAPLAVRRSPRP